jgi:hypothetical protein
MVEITKNGCCSLHKRNHTEFENDRVGFKAPVARGVNKYSCMNVRVLTLGTIFVCLLLAGYHGLSTSGSQTPLKSSFNPLNSRNSSFVNNQQSPFVAKASPAEARQSSYSSREQVFQNALNSGEELQAQALDQLLPEWVSDDPQAAANFVKAMPAGLSRDKALRVLAQVWGEHDPDASRAWGEGLNDKSDTDTFFTNVCLGLIQKDPGAATQMAEQNHSREKGLLENLVQQWAEKDIPASLAWAAQQPRGEERDELLQRVALVQSKTNPAQAAALVVQQISPGPAQIEAAMSVVHQWAERDWDGAVAWVDQFPDGPLHDRAVTELNGMVRDPAQRIE